MKINQVRVQCEAIFYRHENSGSNALSLPPPFFWMICIHMKLTIFSKLTCAHKHIIFLNMESPAKEAHSF